MVRLNRLRVKTWVMRGRHDGQRQLLDIESLAAHVLLAGSVFKLLADHRYELFPSDAFEDLFRSGRGVRPLRRGDRVGDGFADVA